MRRRLLLVFWIINTSIMGLHLINYYFTQGQGNLLEEMALFLYRQVLPYLNLLISGIALVTVILLGQRGIKIKFLWERELVYLFFFMLVSISTSAAKSTMDADFIFYLCTVVIFAVMACLLPKKEVRVNLT